MEYRKKPVVIEAMLTKLLIQHATNDWGRLPEWMKKAYDEGNIVFLPDAIRIRTLEGTMTAEPDDMVIRGVKGELYPCKPDIFAATYDVVAPTNKIEGGR